MHLHINIVCRRRMCVLMVSMNSEAHMHMPHAHAHASEKKMSPSPTRRICLGAIKLCGGSNCQPREGTPGKVYAVVRKELGRRRSVCRVHAGAAVLLLGLALSAPRAGLLGKVSRGTSTAWTGSSRDGRTRSEHRCGDADASGRGTVARFRFGDADAIDDLLNLLCASTKMMIKKADLHARVETDTGHRTQDAGRRTQDAGRSMQHTAQRTHSTTNPQHNEPTSTHTDTFAHGTWTWTWTCIDMYKSESNLSWEYIYMEHSRAILEH